VSSWDILTSFVAIPAGNALAGPLAHTFGTARVIVVAAVVMALASFAPMLVRGSRDLRRTVGEPAHQPVPIASPDHPEAVTSGRRGQ
jgi:MFS family permease